MSNREIVQVTGDLTPQVAEVLAQRQSLLILAQRNPRDADKCREKILARCADPAFAESAFYALPRTKRFESDDDFVEFKRKHPEAWKDPKDNNRIHFFIYGNSIRAAEVVERTWGNLMVAESFVKETESQIVWGVQVYDAESNFYRPGEVAIPKMWRRWRNGSQQWEPVPADELNIQIRSQLSRIRRNLILEVCAGDLIDQMLETSRKAAEKQASTDGGASLDKVFEKLDEVGMSEADVFSILNVGTKEEITPKMVATLRGVYTVLRDGLSSRETLLHKDVADPNAKPEPVKKTQEVKMLGTASVIPPKKDEPPQPEPEAETTPDGKALSDEFVVWFNEKLEAVRPVSMPERKWIMKCSEVSKAFGETSWLSLPKFKLPEFYKELTKTELDIDGMPD